MLYQLIKPRSVCCLPQMNPRLMPRFSSIYTSAAWSSAHATPWSGTWRWIGVCSTVTLGRTPFWERRSSIHTRSLLWEKWTLVWSGYVNVSFDRLLPCVRRPITTVPLWRMWCCASHGRWTSPWAQWLRVTVWQTYWQLYWPPWRSSGTLVLWLVFSIYHSVVFSAPDFVVTLGFLFSRFSTGWSLIRIREWQW